MEKLRVKSGGLGLFLGKNCNNKAIPFGYCFINTETAESFADLFRSFFDIMKAESSVIITDEQAAIDSALQQLKR